MAAQFTATNGFGFAGAEVVEGAGDEFLAGSAFAGDEDGYVGGGDLLDEAEDLAHGLANCRRDRP